MYTSLGISRPIHRVPAATVRGVRALPEMKHCPRPLAFAGGMDIEDGSAGL